MPTPPALALPDERQRAILDRLARDGRVIAADLAEAFGTSEDTIRRDLRILAAAGQCRRVYGGALPLSPVSGTFAERRAEAPARKAALAEAAARLVADRLEPGQVLVLDAGSTNLAIAQALPADLSITAVTNTPHIAAALLDRPGIDLVVIGGRVDPRGGAAYGGRALRDAMEIRADLVLLGACAVDAGAGIATFDAEEAVFKQAVAERAAAVAVATVNEKLGTRAPFGVVPATALTHLLVEADAPAATLAPFAAFGTCIHRAKPAP